MFETGYCTPKGDTEWYIIQDLFWSTYLVAVYEFCRFYSLVADKVSARFESDTHKLSAYNKYPTLRLVKELIKIYFSYLYNQIKSRLAGAEHL